MRRRAAFIPSKKDRIMTNNASVGAIELSSIGVGYQVQDALMKAANTTLIIARTICSGKYLIVFSDFPIILFGLIYGNNLNYIYLMPIIRLEKCIFAVQSHLEYAEKENRRRSYPVDYRL